MFQSSPPNRIFGDFCDDRETVNDHLRQSGMEWQAVYKIFIDRIEFDSDALEKYLEIPLQGGSHSAGQWIEIPLRNDGPELREIIDDGDPIPEVIFFKDIEQITICETTTSWFKTIGANHYNVGLKNGQNLKIPWDFRYRYELETHGLHIWWNELRDGKVPSDLMAYTNYVEKRYGDSELKNTCTRCGKIWYLGADELEDLEGRLTNSVTMGKQMGGIGMISAMFNPMLAAQTATTMAASTGAMKSLADDLNEKSRCPECQSKNIDRVLVDGNEKIEKVVEGAPQETNKKEGSSLADELKKLSELKEQGILDEEEFKTAKQKLIEKQ